MARFICTIGLAGGRIETRELDGDSAEQLRQLLESQGMHTIAIRKASWLSHLKALGGYRLATRDLLTFNKELLVLIKSGLPILQALETIAEHWAGSERFTRILQQVCDDLRGGSTLAGAMERHGTVFPDLYRASVAAGERTGDLAVTIRRYTRFLARAETVRKKIVSSLYYPVILVVTACLAVALLLLYVVPTFSRIFADAGGQLPFLTRLLISFSTGLRFWLPLLLLPVLLFWFPLQRWITTDSGRSSIDSLKLKVPLFGEVMHKYSVAAFSRTMGTLLGSGIPLVESLRTAAGTLHNRYLEKKLYEGVLLVEEGASLAASLERVGLMPLLALRMLAVGERTGALEELFDGIAEYLEAEVEDRIHLLTTAVEPGVMVIMGALVGFIIIAMYLPIFRIAGTVG